MGIARNIARLIPNGSGLLPNANIEAVAASKLTGQVPDANAPSGGVVQVVSTSITSSYSGTLGAEIYVGMSASITPSNANNKILVLFDVAMGLNGTASNFACYVRLRRAASTSGTFLYVQRFGQYHGSTQGREMFATTLLQYLDSPNTTSAVTYGMTVENLDGNATYSINNNGHTTITLLEIAA